MPVYRLDERAASAGKVALQKRVVRFGAGEGGWSA